MRNAILVMLMGLCVIACGASTKTADTVVICPGGSIYDPSRSACVAVQGLQPVVATPPASKSAPPPTTVVPPIASAPPIVDAGAPIVAAIDAGAAPLVAPPAGTIAVDVSCGFPNGWVTVLPTSKYPKDDQFLMQALIGLTSDPKFWNGLSEYTPLRPYAARKCTSSATRFTVASGDYWILAGQEGTFSAKGKYDKNGVKRKITVAASTVVSLQPADLTFTWLCVSCPWLVFSDGAGGDLDPFVVLAWRSSQEKRGTDRRAVRGVAVRNGKITLRVVETERETTHLDALALTVKGTTLYPRATILRNDDGKELILSHDTQSTLEFDVPGMVNATVDVEVSATGWYAPD